MGDFEAMSVFMCFFILFGCCQAGNLPGMLAGLLQSGVSMNDPDSLPSAAEPGRRVSDGLKALVSMAPDRGEDDTLKRKWS